jgi:hypothetical protein
MITDNVEIVRGALCHQIAEAASAVPALPSDCKNGHAPARSGRTTEKTSARITGL